MFFFPIKKGFQTYKSILFCADPAYIWRKLIDEENDSNIRIEAANVDESTKILIHSLNANG